MGEEATTGEFMKCKYQRQIDDFVRNKLAEDKAKEFKEHLKGCASCRNEVGLLQKVKFTLKHKPLFPIARMTQSGGAPEKDINVVDNVMAKLGARQISQPAVYKRAAPITPPGKRKGPRK